MKNEVIIIGAGMAGLTAALILAQQGISVRILESNDKIGKKLLMTGNGRCNLTNQHMTQANFHSSSKNLYELIPRYMDVAKTTRFLWELGIDLVELDEGKLYPRSLQASSVVKALLFECERRGVRIDYQKKVTKVSYDKEFKIFCHKNDPMLKCQKLILATGGKSYPDTGSTGDGYQFAKTFGHTIIKPYPSIVQVKTNSPYNKSLKGFKCECVGTLTENNKTIRTEVGEVLWTDYGLSGPVILQLSTMIGNRIDTKSNLGIVLDLIPSMTERELHDYLVDRFQRLKQRTVEEALNGFLHFRLIQPILKNSLVEHQRTSDSITHEDCLRLTQSLKYFKQTVTDLYLWNQAQVTKGGVDCKEVNPLTLESLKQKKLYFAGEVLDMDGDCGGYNLQWAITSGYVVAKALLENK
jgi:predicted Rossmann fold flavoprotein